MSWVSKIGRATTLLAFQVNCLMWQQLLHWEMWFKLAIAHGSAATNRVVVTYREHHSMGRGTTEVNISGRKYACGNMQRKRHIAWLSKLRPNLRFDRKALLKQAPMSTRYILEHGYKFSPMLRYNAGLLHLSSAPLVRYRLFQVICRLFSWHSLRVASRGFQLMKRLRAGACPQTSLNAIPVSAQQQSIPTARTRVPDHYPSGE